MQLGAMQDWSLRVTRFIDHAAREHGGREIVTHWADGSESRTTWASIRHDAMRMAQKLATLEIKPGDRIATLAMNHHRHLVTWYGAVGVGGVLHTINPRLFDDQLDYIVNHAEDRVLLFDAAFALLVERMKPRWPTIEHYICFDSATPAEHFEDWIGTEDGQGEWADGDGDCST
jgi:fatty-acyl-CoA synthase